MYKELKKKYEQDKLEMKALCEKLKDSDTDSANYFEVEPNDTNTIMCSFCDIDTCFVWISELMRNGDEKFWCLRCADKNVKYIRDSFEKFAFYYKYEEEELNIFWKRLEGRITDPDYQDTGLQWKLLLKLDWPQVRTKQDLLEEGKEVIFYGDSKKKPVPKSPEDQLKFVHGFSLFI